MTKLVKTYLFNALYIKEPTRGQSRGQSDSRVIGWVPVRDSILRHEDGRSLQYEFVSRPEIHPGFEDGRDRFESIEGYEAEVHERNEAGTPRWLTFADFETHYNERVLELVNQLGGSIAHHQMSRQSIDFIIVAAENIVDILSAAAANMFIMEYQGKRNGKEKLEKGVELIPIVLRIGETLLRGLEKEANVRDFMSYTPLGNPSMPFNLKISEKALGELQGMDAPSHLGEDAWRFVKGLAGLTEGGMLAIVSEILPFIGALLIERKDQVARFQDLKGLILPERIPIGVLGPQNNETEAKEVTEAKEIELMLSLLERARENGYWALEPGELVRVINLVFTL